MNTKVDMTFARALKAMLRQDPGWFRSELALVLSGHINCYFELLVLKMGIEGCKLTMTFDMFEA